MRDRRRAAGVQAPGFAQRARRRDSEKWIPQRASISEGGVDALAGKPTLACASGPPARFSARPTARPKGFWKSLTHSSRATGASAMAQDTPQTTAESSPLHLPQACWPLFARLSSGAVPGKPSNADACVRWGPSHQITYTAYSRCLSRVGCLAGLLAVTSGLPGNLLYLLKVPV